MESLLNLLRWVAGALRWVVGIWHKLWPIAIVVCKKCGDVLGIRG